MLRGHGPVSYTHLDVYKRQKEASLPFGDGRLRIAVVNGLANAEKLIEKLESGEAEYDFVAVMACPGGCIAGAGQPFARKQEKEDRAKGLYDAAKLSQVKRSEENPVMMALYGGVLKNKSHELLHVDYNLSLIHI